MVSKESVLQETDENERVQGHMDVEFLGIIENFRGEDLQFHILNSLSSYVGLRQGYFA